MLDATERLKRSQIVLRNINVLQVLILFHAVDGIQVETLESQRQERVPRIVECLANLVKALLHDIFIDLLFIVVDGDRASGQLLFRHL